MYYREAERAHRRREYERALGLFQKAFDLDSTMVEVRLRSVVTYMNLGDWEAADSLLDLLDLVRGQMSEKNRIHYLLRRAQQTRDLRAMYEWSKRQFESQPDGMMGYLGNVGQYAMNLNRPREAIRVLTSLTQTPGTWASYRNWNHLAQSHHMVGQHEEELEIARHGRSIWPNVLEALQDEVEALAAMGRVDEVHPLLQEALTFPAGSPGVVMRAAALEFREHGYSEEAGAMLDRAITWYDRLPEAERATETHRYELARLHYEAGHGPRAWQMFQDLATEFPEDHRYLGYLGLLAAREGDVTTAQRVSQTLSGWTAWAPSGRNLLRGGHTFMRAKISALMGEKAHAVTLLREAHAQGHPFDIALCRDIDLESLRDFPPFRNFMEPKG
jgi:tetratricopeptide (TPR) repeat protein